MVPLAARRRRRTRRGHHGWRRVAAHGARARGRQLPREPALAAPDVQHPPRVGGWIDAQLCQRVCQRLSLQLAEVVGARVADGADKRAGGGGPGVRLRSALLAGGTGGCARRSAAGSQRWVGCGARETQASAVRSSRRCPAHTCGSPLLPPVPPLPSCGAALPRWRRHRSLQYFTSSQFFAQDFLHSMGRPQTRQILTGSWPLPAGSRA